MLIHCTGPFDWQESTKSLQILTSNLIKHKNTKTKIYLMIVGPTKRSISESYVLSYQNGFQLIAQVQPRCQTQAKKNCERRDLAHTIQCLVDAVHTHEKKMDVFMFSGHSNSFILGRWVGYKHPLMSIEELNRIVLDRFRPKLAIFDSCAMGSMSSLYNLPTTYLEIVQASPSLHPYVSTIELNAIFTKTTSVKTLADAIAREWHHRAGSRRDFDRCFLSFDMTKIRKVGVAIRKHWKDLIFDRRSQLDQKDYFLHDTWTAARNIPTLQRLLESVTLNFGHAVSGTLLPSDHVQKRCCAPCQRARSVSVETRTPGKWKRLFLNTKWIQFMNQKEINFK